MAGLSASSSTCGLTGSGNTVQNVSILVVEDETDIREMISYNLLQEGYQVAAVDSGEEALTLLESGEFDAVLLDLMLPGMDGLGVCRELKLRPATRSTPIIIISAKRDETDVVVGLKLGADDYITKPFSPRVLLARVEAVLRRTAARNDEDRRELSETPIFIHELEIHPKQHLVRLSGATLELSRTEFQVLSLLANKPGWVFTRQQILDGLYGEKYAVTDRAVDVQIVGLRKKLGAAGKYIETVRGVGYRFKE